MNTYYISGSAQRVLWVSSRVELDLVYHKVIANDNNQNKFQISLFCLKYELCIFDFPYLVLHAIA